MSPLSQGRELKLIVEQPDLMPYYVAPLAGARIEIARGFSQCAAAIVAPLAGARIEIIAG